MKKIESVAMVGRVDPERMRKGLKIRMNLGMPELK
jgi:hypothetical protein